MSGLTLGSGQKGVNLRLIFPSDKVSQLAEIR